jgi:hypothetical protein
MGESNTIAFGIKDSELKTQDLGLVSCALIDGPSENASDDWWNLLKNSGFLSQKEGRQIPFFNLGSDVIPRDLRPTQTSGSS